MATTRDAISNTHAKEGECEDRADAATGQKLKRDMRPREATAASRKIGTRREG
jgi:hypothetical protein